jgi:hypothetical protein
VGEIYNAAGSTVHSVVLTAHLYDETGGLIGSYSGTTAFDATLPGDTNLFSIWTAFDIDEPGDYQVTVDRWATASMLEYGRVTVVSHTLDQGSWSSQVSGEIRNDHRRTLAAIQLLVEPGTNGAYQFIDLDTTALGPGRTMNFTTSILHPWEPPPSSVAIRGQGHLRP